MLYVSAYAKLYGAHTIAYYGVLFHTFYAFAVGQLDGRRLAVLASGEVVGCVCCLCDL